MKFLKRVAHLIFPLRHWLGQRQWGRRWLGGHWEEWFIDPCNSIFWMQEDKCVRHGNHNPGWCYQCEHYGLPFAEDVPDGWLGACEKKACSGGGMADALR